MPSETLPRREREKMRQRKEMLDAALDLFSEKGYHNASMQEIAHKSEFAIGTLYKVLDDWFPGAADYGQAQPWVGARPMLPDGPPVLGVTPVANVYLNVGHGSTGWAMACGSARLLADIVAGREPQIDLEGLTLERYARRGKA